jgi:KUP system potassium uptake protein
VLNYLGQGNLVTMVLFLTKLGALILRDPTALSNPFYLSVSEKLYWPLFVLATLATVIASQAMITGCFSLISQAISLNFCPPLAVLHTSKSVIGQIYVPAVNYVLLVLTIVVIAAFGSSAKISEAYGVTVCTVMIATTVLYTSK